MIEELREDNILLYRVVKCPCPNLKFYYTRATNMLIKFALFFCFFPKNSGREGLV